MSGRIEIHIGDMSDVEGHVYARYISATPAHNDAQAAERVLLRGTLRGPYCELAHTLPAEFMFQDAGSEEPGLARAIVPDPCLWSPELPHLYQADVEARQGDLVLAEYHGKIGLRRK